MSIFLVVIINNISFLATTLDIQASWYNWHQNRILIKLCFCCLVNSQASDKMTLYVFFLRGLLHILLTLCLASVVRKMPLLMFDRAMMPDVRNDVCIWRSLHLLLVIHSFVWKHRFVLKQNNKIKWKRN